MATRIPPATVATIVGPVVRYAPRPAGPAYLDDVAGTPWRSLEIAGPDRRIAGPGSADAAEDSSTQLPTPGGAASATMS